MGWMELLVVGVVALIVVGPKDLPVMFQALGRITAKVKRMAREFQMAMTDAAKASGTSDITKDLRGLTSPKSLGLDKLTSAADSFERWDPMASTTSSTTSKSKFGKKADTGTLTEERAEQAKAIRESTAKTAQERLDHEAAEAVEESGVNAAEPSDRNLSGALGQVAAGVEKSNPSQDQAREGENRVTEVETPPKSGPGEPLSQNVSNSASESERLEGPLPDELGEESKA